MNDDFLDQLQADVFGVLSATPSLMLARKLLDNKGDLEGRIENELATSNDDSGKCGLAIIVLAPEVDEAEVNLPGPPLTVTVEVQVIEHAELNRSAGDGTLIRSSTAAVRALAALHLRNLGSYFLTAAAKQPIRPLPMRPGFISHIISATARFDGPPVLEKPLGVTATMTDGDLYLSSATPESLVYYTTDGRFPTEADELATVNSPGAAWECRSYVSNGFGVVWGSDVIVRVHWGVTESADVAVSLGGEAAETNMETIRAAVMADATVAAAVTLTRSGAQFTIANNAVGYFSGASPYLELIRDIYSADPLDWINAAFSSGAWETQYSGTTLVTGEDPALGPVAISGLAAGTQVRAAAYVAGQAPSDVTELVITD